MPNERRLRRAAETALHFGHPVLVFRFLFWWRLFGMCRRSWLCSWFWCSRFRRDFRSPSRLLGSSGALRFGRSWRRLRRGLRMSNWRCIWRRMRRCWGVISRLRRFSRPRCWICCSGRTRNIRLCPRGGFGSYGVVLQLRDAGSWTRHCGMRGNTMIRRSKIGLVLFRN